jgi:hypothetical protein
MLSMAPEQQSEAMPDVSGYVGAMPEGRQQAPASPQVSAGSHCAPTVHAIPMDVVHHASELASTEVSPLQHSFANATGPDVGPRHEHTELVQCVETQLFAPVHGWPFGSGSAQTPALHHPETQASSPVQEVELDSLAIHVPSPQNSEMQSASW